MTFVVKGLSEVYDPRGGYPIAARDALLSTWSDPVYAGADAQGAGAGQRDRASHRGRAPTRGSARPARPHAAPASADRQLDARAAAAAVASFTVFEKTRHRSAGRDDPRPRHQRGHRPRLPDPPDTLRSERARPSARCWPSTREPSPTHAHATPTARPAACAARSTAYPSCSRTTSTRRSCPRPAAPGRCWITGRGSIRAWPRA